MWFHNKVYMYYLLINCCPNRQCYKSSRRRVGHEWPPSLPIGGGLGARIFSLLTGCFPILSLSLSVFCWTEPLSLSLSPLSLSSFLFIGYLRSFFYQERQARRGLGVSAGHPLPPRRPPFRTL